MPPAATFATLCNIREFDCTQMLRMGSAGSDLRLVFLTRNLLERQLQITFRGMETSAAVEARVQERVDKLDQLSDRIIGCHVVVDSPDKHSRNGGLFSVNAELRVSGGEPIVAGKSHHNDQGHEDVYVSIRDTFDALERQLHDRVEKARDHKQGSPRA